jgi:hypothetical protein
LSRKEKQQLSAFITKKVQSADPAIVAACRMIHGWLK